jgi:hypothetical protein
MVMPFAEWAKAGLAGTICAKAGKASGRKTRLATVIDTRPVSSGVLAMLMGTVWGARLGRVLLVPTLMLLSRLYLGRVAPRCANSGWCRNQIG